MEKGRDGTRRETTQSEAMLHTRSFSEEMDEEDGGMETPCAFSGQRETHGPVSVEVSFLPHKKERDSVNWEKRKKINSN